MVLPSWATSGRDKITADDVMAGHQARLWATQKTINLVARYFLKGGLSAWQIKAC